MNARDPQPLSPSRPLAAFPPDRDEALARADAIEPRRYARTRAQLDGSVTRLSPYLTHGIVSVPEVARRVSAQHGLTVHDKLVAELAWREYFQHLWRHLGEDIFQPVRRPPAPKQCYADAVPGDLVEGRTGVPAVDRAVRALYATGYLHNRARLWLASYAVHLRKVDWRAGAHWMYGHLLDGDLASNALSWQWVAGTLTGRPYLFNAENVARFAPRWSSPGTAIDRPLDVIAQLAGSAERCGPETGASPVGADEPPRLPGPPQGLADFDRGALAGARQVVLVHPWALGARRPASAAIGCLHLPFHARHPWSPRRWAFVLERMRAVTDTVFAGDVSHLVRELAGHRLVSRETLNPGYAESLAPTGVEPLPRLFEDPAKPQPSFSRFWARVSRNVSPAMFA